MGFLQRDGKVYLKHVAGTGKWTVIEQVKYYVDPKARVMTNEWVSYIQLKKHGYFHQSINHKKTFVMGQGIENVWSHLKRGVYGVYLVALVKSFSKIFSSIVRSFLVCPSFFFFILRLYHDLNSSVLRLYEEKNLVYFCRDSTIVSISFNVLSSHVGGTV